MKFDSLGWLDEAVEVDYLNKSESREGYAPKFLILHSTAGGSSAQGIANYFATGSEQASAHIIIDQQGTIVQGVPLSLAAWANGPIDGTPADLGFRTESDGIHRDSWWDPNVNPNFLTRASIEHVKASIDNSNQLTPAQQAASFAVVKAICDTYDIPKRFADAQGGITGHFSMSAINRQHCPGPYPWNDLWAYLQQEESMTIDLSNPTVASHFIAAPNGAWHCPATNATIGGEILAFYCKFGGDSLCGLTHWGLPLTPELPIPDRPGTVMQRFERAVVAFDPLHTIDSPPEAGRVYLLHIDSGIGQDPRVKDLQGQVAALGIQLTALQPAALVATNAALQAKIVQAVKDLS